MAKTLRGLAGVMDRLAAKIGKNSERIAVETALAVLFELVTSTPVDTTKAVSNWQVAINVPVVTEINAYFAGRYGATAASSINAAVRKAKSQLRGFKSGNTIHISNLVDYIETLNNGGSRQEPAGFVERAILVGKLHVKQAKLRV